MGKFSDLKNDFLILEMTEAKVSFCIMVQHCFPLEAKIHNAAFQFFLLTKPGLSSLQGTGKDMLCIVAST